MRSLFDMCFTSFLERALAALTSKDEKTLLLMYDDFSSTVSNRIRSFDLGRKYLDVYSNPNRKPVAP